MIPRERIEATMRFLGCDYIQALNHERQRSELLRRNKCAVVRRRAA